MIDVKILAGYLPYNLQFEGGGDIWTMYSIGTEGALVLKNGLHTEVIHQDNVGVEYKPLLLPVTTMTLIQKWEFYESFQEFFTTWNLKAIQTIGEKHNWFLERHYDIHDLIGQGMAVNMPITEGNIHQKGCVCRACMGKHPMPAADVNEPPMGDPLWRIVEDEWILPDNKEIPTSFTCRGCGHELDIKFQERTLGFCYLCDPNITLKELLNDV